MYRPDNWDRELKLLYLSTSRVPSEKANTNQVMQMCDAFSSCGADITLLHPRRVNTPDMRQVDDVHRYYGSQNEFRLVSLPTVDFLRASDWLLGWVPRLNRVVQVPLFRLLIHSYSRSILRYLEHHSAEVLYTRSIEVVQTLNRTRPDLSPIVFFEAHSYPQSPEARRKAGRTLRQIGGTVTVTRHLGEMIVDSGVPRARTLVAPDGVDLRRFSGLRTSKAEARNLLGLPADCYLVGYAGRFHTLGEEKGIRELIHAISILGRHPRQHKVALCCVGGPDEMARQYQAAASQLGLRPDEVIFSSQVAPTEVPLYLRAFDLLVMPHPWTPFYAYCVSPLKLFEYMAAERPIIASELPSIKEILHHGRNAYLVPPGDPQALADGIRRLMVNRHEANALARQARVDVEQYTWSTRARQILDFAMGRIPEFIDGAGSSDTQ